VANIRHERLPDNSPGALARWQEREDAWLAALKHINPSRIAGRPEFIAYGIMRGAIEGSIATRVCRYELWSVAHAGGGWLSTITSLAALQGVGTDDARRQVLARWHAIPAYIATEMANHREGLRRGYTAPRNNVQIALNEIDTLLATPIDQSPLYDPARRDSTPGFGTELAQLIDHEIIRRCGAIATSLRRVPRTRPHRDRVFANRTARTVTVPAFVRRPASHSQPIPSTPSASWPLTSSKAGCARSRSTRSARAMSRGSSSGCGPIPPSRSGPATRC